MFSTCQPCGARSDVGWVFWIDNTVTSHLMDPMVERLVSTCQPPSHYTVSDSCATIGHQ
jgi:hypothetical protein